MVVILCLNHLFVSYKMASKMGLQAFQISTCYKMAGHGKVISYKMTLEIDLIWAWRQTMP